MNVFVVEDSEIIRDALNVTLATIPGVNVVGFAVDEQGAIEKINVIRPDLIILDIHLESGSGIEVLRAVKKHHPATKVMMLTSCDEDIYVRRCMSAGADYYFDKSKEFMRVGTVISQLELTGGESGAGVAEQNGARQLPN